MTFIWLIVWLCNNTPQLAPWNAWLVALIVCVALDLMEIERKRHRSAK